MKRHYRSKEADFVHDPDFADALCEGESQRLSSQRKAERKTRQFCWQVRRALNLALAERGIFVEEVFPAPDCGHLLVRVVIPDGSSAADAMADLRRDASRLRSEVAMAITRKRVPELSFVPAIWEGGVDE